MQRAGRGWPRGPGVPHPGIDTTNEGLDVHRAVEVVGSAAWTAPLILASGCRRLPSPASGAGCWDRRTRSSTGPVVSPTGSSTAIQPLIARPLDAADVASALAFGREGGLRIAVRAGGHSAAGHSTGDGVLVIDLSAMKGIEIDPASRTAWVEAGVVAGELTRAAFAHGLAVPFGDTGSVGAAGITLAAASAGSRASTA